MAALDYRDPIYIRRFLFMVALCGLLIGNTGTLWAADVKPFAVAIHNGHVAKAQRTLRVMEGDQVEISFTTDKATELHLHGIDITVTVKPGAPATMSFTARHAGRFPVEAHGAGRHAGLLYVEVHPR